VTDSWRIDTAFDSTLPGPREVPDNSADYTEWPGLANVSPGTHEGGVYTLELAAQYLY
jgi:hypothetical protein